MCVIIASKIKLKNSEKDNWFLYKIRDRAYTPEYKIRYTTSKFGVQAGFLVDNKSDWTEGINENGLMIVNSALQNHEDKEDGTKIGKKKNKNKVSRNGMIIREALRQTNIQEAVDVLVESRFDGNTFVSDGKRLFVLEIFLHQDTKDAILADLEIDPIDNEDDVRAILKKNIKPEDYNVEVKEIKEDRLVVRTNHGVLLNNAGYQPEDGIGWKSSNSRKDIIENTLKELKPSHPFEVLTATKNLNNSKTHKIDMMRPIRTKPDSPYASSTILCLTGTGSMYILPLNCTFQDTSFNRVQKDRGVHIVVLPKNLPLFEDFNKYLKLEMEQIPNPTIKSFAEKSSKSVAEVEKICDEIKDKQVIDKSIERNMKKMYDKESDKMNFFELLGLNKDGNKIKKEIKMVESEETYKEFFAKKLEKYKVKSPAELSDEDKKKFYDEVDAEWKGEKEEVEEAVKVTTQYVVQYFKQIQKIIGASDFDITVPNSKGLWQVIFEKSKLFGKNIALGFKNIEGKKIGAAYLIGFGYGDGKFYPVPSKLTSIKDIKKYASVMQNIKGTSKSLEQLEKNSTKNIGIGVAQDSDKQGNEYKKGTFGYWWTVEKGNEDIQGESYIDGIDCSFGNLTSLEGAPKEANGSFICNNNKLTSLEGAPEKVGGYFNCSHNYLTSLEGAPQKVGGYFDCTVNHLKSLEGAPKEVMKDFLCSDNYLTSLEGAPQKVGGSFKCNSNKLTSLKGAPEKISEDFECSDNKLTSLEGAPKEVGGDFSCEYNNRKVTDKDIEDVSKVKGRIITGSVTESFSIKALYELSKDNPTGFMSITKDAIFNAISKNEKYQEIRTKLEKY